MTKGINDEGHVMVSSLNQDNIPVYESIVIRIKAGSVTIGDFNKLIDEALDKSTRERVMRHARVESPHPREFSPIGRVVPKRSGINNPPEQGRGKRFATGTIAKRKQNQKQRQDHAGD